MKLKLKEIEVTKIDGSKQKLKLDYKGLANYIFNQTKDLGELELARELYKKGEIGVDVEILDSIELYSKEAFGALVLESLLPKLQDLKDKLINKNELDKRK